MYHHVKKLMYTVRVDVPDPKFGNMLLEQFGGANGEANLSSTALGCWTLPGTSGYTNEPLVKFGDLTLPPGARVTGASLRLVFENWERNVTLRGRYLRAAWNPRATSFGWAYRDTGLAWAQPGARGDGTDLVSGPSFTLTSWPGQGVDVQIIALDVADPAGAGYLSQVGPRLRASFREAPVLLRPLGNTIYVMPPYCIDEADLATVGEAIAAAVTALA